MSELAVENLQLRAQNISLAGQLSREKDKIRRMLHDAETAVSNPIALQVRVARRVRSWGTEQHRTKPSGQWQNWGHQCLSSWLYLVSRPCARATLGI